MPQTSTRISRFPLDAARVVSDGSIRIQSIFVSNASASAVEVTFKDNDAVPVLNMVVPANDSESFVGFWIANNGLNIDSLSDGDIIVTILHSYGGA